MDVISLLKLIPVINSNIMGTGTIKEKLSQFLANLSQSHFIPYLNICVAAYYEISHLTDI